MLLGEAAPVMTQTLSFSSMRPARRYLALCGNTADPLRKGPGGGAECLLDLRNRRALTLVDALGVRHRQRSHGVALRVGIEKFRWHDLRHTWASWLVQAGTPLHVLQELGGWECVDMVRKYAHLSTAHLTEYVDHVSSLRLVASDGVATFRLHGQK